MRYVKKFINLVFGTNYNTAKHIPPSKKRLIANMYREYGAQDW
jgi:hypothetical protein